MNGLIKQLFTPNYPVVQLAEHKTEDLRRICWPRFKFKEFCKIKLTIYVDVTTSWSLLL